MVAASVESWVTLQKNCLWVKKSKDSIHFFEEITNHAGIYLSIEDDLKLVILLEEEPTEDTLFSADVYEKSSDI